MNVHVTFPIGTVRLDPGDVVDREAVVHNTGRTTDRFTTQVVGSAATWTTAWPPVLELAAGASAPLRVRFHPPRAAHVRAGQTPFGLLTVSEQARSTSLVEELLLLTRFEDLSVELCPPMREERRAEFHLLVHNGGNAPVHLSIRTRDMQEQLVLRCEPGSLTVYPGQSASCRVRARTRATRLECSPRQFQVIAHPAGGDPLVVTGTLLVPPPVHARLRLVAFPTGGGRR